MSRYIDVNNVVDLLVEFSTLAIYEECSKELLDAAEYFKKRAHTADVEEVVKCKDCKNCDKVDDYELWCCGHGMPYRLTTADDFCSHGKRKKEKEE